MTAFLNFIPILLAIGCYVLAGAFAQQPDVHNGLLMLAGALAGWSIPRLGDAFKKAAVVLAFGLGLGALAYSPAARADINLDDIAPKLTKCWGTTCVMPDAAVNATLFNLGTKKWEVGTTSLGAGVALLFAADQAIASGLTVHLTGVLSQEAGKASFYMPTVGIVIARYFEAGFSRRFATDEPNANYISIAGNIPWDVFTKATLPQRVERVKAGKLTAEDF
jgi:hypothetical protein